MSAPAASAPPDAEPPATQPSPVTASPLTRVLSILIFAGLALLLTEVLLESWVQERLSDRSVDANGAVVGELSNLPKDLKNGLFLLLAGLAAAKVTVERRWREFTTRADIALAVLAVLLVTAGLLGESGLVLTGEGVFVYLRAAAVFYAIRALRPTWAQIRVLGWIVGGLAAVHTVIAVAQTIIGRPAYTGVGIVDAFAARNFRGQGLLHHPNDLGHVLGLLVIGLVAWLAQSAKPDAQDTAGRRTRQLAWVAVAVCAVGIGAAQSRESLLAVLAAVAVIWFLSSGRASGTRWFRNHAGRVAVVAVLVISAGFATNLVTRPSHLAGLMGRIGAVFSAVETPSGSEQCEGFESTHDCVYAGKVEYRELRVLFLQQGARLLAQRPLLGYGTGQFGGTVAEQNDPQWELDPRFPGGFDLHDLDGTTVDLFWLHLVVEAGVLGLLSYLVWLWLLSATLTGVTPRYAGRRVWGSPAREPADQATRTVALWGVGALLFAVLAGFFSNAPLEGPILPPILFTVLGLGWSLARDVPHKVKSQPRHARVP